MEEIKPTHVNFEQAKWLKEIGFNLAIDGRFYWDENLQWSFSSKGAIKWNRTEEGSYPAPEQWQLIKWLWDTYLIDVSVIPVRNKGEKSINFQFRVINFSDPEVDEVMFEHQYNRDFMCYITKEEAYSAAFDYLKEII